jgi:hypothetical protein
MSPLGHHRVKSAVPYVPMIGTFRPGIGVRSRVVRWHPSPMARMKDVVFDCRHPASLARFWAAALDGYAVAPYDEAELERLRGIGIYDVEDDPSVLVEAAEGSRMFFQLVPESKVVKNRVHLDLTSDDSGAEVGRLVGLGAVVVAEYEDHVLLTDPEGNEFCLSR